MSCPTHYQLTTLFRKDGSPAEVIDICDEIAPTDPNHFQAIEYLLRSKRKGQYLSDLEKCKFYVQRMIEKEKSETIEKGCENCRWYSDRCEEPEFVKNDRQSITCGGYAKWEPKS